jgi:hypothetical protein
VKGAPCSLFGGENLNPINPPLIQQHGLVFTTIKRFDTTNLSNIHATCQQMGVCSSS